MLFALPGVPDELAADAGLLSSDAYPIHPMRIYGELAPLLEQDAVVIGDGGDFVSYAGKYVEPRQPGAWLDPGPYGCLGTGLGYAIAARIARPAAQVVLLLGDGAAGFSLMDADTLVRHRLPAVMICGNNGIWGLEKHPMQMTSPPTCSRSAATTRWSRRSAGRGNSSPGPGRSGQRCAGPSPPAFRTWSTSRPTRRSPTRARPRASDRSRVSEGARPRPGSARCRPASAPPFRLR